jgi:peptide/nickel transport system substrate-binding protein
MKNKRLMVVFCYNLLIFILGATLLVAGNASSQLKPSQKVTVAVISEPDTLDPTATRLPPINNPIASNIFETFIGIKTSGVLTATIASWEVLEGGKEIEFMLRRGVKFHSGDLLTTKDVEFSHNRAMKLNPTYKRQMRQFDRFEIIDDYKCKAIFKKPDATYLPGRYLYLVSKTYYDRVGEDEFLRKPVGTGPYKFVEWKPGQYLDIEANEDYWGEKPSVKKAHFRFIKEDTTRVAMLRSGEADIILETPFTLVKDLKAAGFKTVDFPSHPTTSIHFHTKNPKVPWGDRRVRLAIAHAIDGDAIVNDLFHGMPARYARLAPWEVGYDPDLRPYPYDPKKAKELLAEAGYPKGFKMPLLYTTGRISGQKETTEAVVLYLNAVGIKCKVTGMEVSQFVEQLRKTHNDPQAEMVAVGTPPMAYFPEPTLALTTTFHSRSVISQYSNPKVDELLDKCRITLDDSKRGELIKQAVGIIHEDIATISLWANNCIYSMKPNIEFTPTLKNRDPLMLIKDVKIR